MPGGAGAGRRRGGVLVPCARRTSTKEACHDDRGEAARRGGHRECVTCLEVFELTKKLEVGQVSNMREIAQRTLGADKVVTV